MRKNRIIEQDRCYHLISRLAHNRRREHSGTMFEGRYHERNHPAERPTMWRTSAYIDINAWEAGMAERPEGYRWCSFAAAARGDRKARAGYAFMYGGESRQPYDGTTGLVFDGASAWCGCTRRNSETGRFESSLIRCVAPGGVE